MDRDLSLVLAVVFTAIGVPAFFFYRDLGMTLLVLAAINYFLHRKGHRITVI